jgi:hypothetical protein
MRKRNPSMLHLVREVQTAVQPGQLKRPSQVARPALKVPGWRIAIDACSGTPFTEAVIRDLAHKGLESFFQNGQQGGAYSRRMCRDFEGSSGSLTTARARRT